jgi:Pyruvate/2-oxoacid:ferredoxin oxidoreductase gamma subunit
MTVNRDQLFAELNKLSADEIEAGLDAGVWSSERRQLVEHYLDQLQVTTMQMEATEAAKAAAQAAEAHSRRATSTAMAALILAAGAMIAAMASAFIAFLALRRYGFQPPW